MGSRYFSNAEKAWRSNRRNRLAFASSLQYEFVQGTCVSVLFAKACSKELLMSRVPVHSHVNGQNNLITSLLLGLIFGAGCTHDDPLTASTCGGHGELHGERCHCDPGFALSDDELSCVPEHDATGDDHDLGHGGGDDHDLGGDAGHGEEELDAAGDDHDHDVGDDHDLGGDDYDLGGDAGHGEEELAFSPSNVRAATGAADDGTQVWLLEASDGGALLALEIYEAFGGPTSPAVVDITDAETSYATCGTCLILRTGCAAHGDHFHCERTFMPRAEGQVHFDALGAGAGERLTGTVLGLVFQEVSIREDFQTELVEDGAVLHLDMWGFDVPLEALDGAGEECGGHGHLHGDHCHCDPGYRLDPNDPAQCIPE